MAWAGDRDWSRGLRGPSQHSTRGKPQCGRPGPRRPFLEAPVKSEVVTGGLRQASCNVGLGQIFAIRLRFTWLLFLKPCAPSSAALGPPSPGLWVTGTLNKPVRCTWRPHFSFGEKQKRDGGAWPRERPQKRRVLRMPRGGERGKERAVALAVLSDGQAPPFPRELRVHHVRLGAGCRTSAVVGPLLGLSTSAL